MAQTTKAATKNTNPEVDKMPWAKLQVDPSEAARFQNVEQQQGEYNIWYHKYAGVQSKTRARAMTRCKTTDAGKTRADVFQTDRAFICIFFARGCCTQGPQCTMYHHIPKTIQDESKYGNGAVDCFGRERHMTERDDMGGVGSMMRPGRTLYIGGLQYNFSQTAEAEEVVARHFAEWGPLEFVNYKSKYGCAFVRYRYRTSAEFAKMAMAEQALDRSEMLNVRWATDDPNPAAIERDAIAANRQFLVAMMEKGMITQEDIASMDPATREMYQLEINSTLSSMPQATVFSATTTPALVGPQPQPQAEVENHVAAAPAVPTDYPIPYPVRADAPSELPLELTPIAKYHPLFDYTNQMYDNPRAHLYFLAYFKPYGFEWDFFSDAMRLPQPFEKFQSKFAETVEKQVADKLAAERKQKADKLNSLLASIDSLAGAGEHQDQGEDDSEGQPSAAKKAKVDQAQ